MLFYLEIVFNKSEHSLKLTFIKHDRFYETTQIVMICQDRNEMMIIFEIMFLLLICCDKKQEFLIMRLLFDFDKNYFFEIKDN